LLLIGAAPQPLVEKLCCPAERLVGTDLERAVITEATAVVALG
jgi:hypothetical protein